MHVSKHFKCECSSHSLEVEKYSEENDIYFSFWEYGNSGRSRTSAWGRIKQAWQILRHGNLLTETVILSEEQALELAELVKKAYNKNLPL